MTQKTDDIRIKSVTELVSPAQVIESIPLTDLAAKTVFDSRTAIHNIIHGHDDRLLVVVGPCSIHDTKAAKEYAERLCVIRQRYQETLHIVMRVYFEKPRTTVGWKGLINDPDLNGSFHINKGLRVARELLMDLNTQGVPAATEFLDLITPQYYADLISWGAIGARTTESQVHRELASGLSCPVGFKNGTNGNLAVAVDAMRAVSEPHIFLSVTKQGYSAIVSTTGNEDCHVILRGGKEPNYDRKHIHAAVVELDNAVVNPRLMIDLSHGNSQKQYKRQLEVGLDVKNQISHGEQNIMAVMLESHLVGGQQNVINGKAVIYGQSITDACLSWDETVPLIDQLAVAVQIRRENKTKSIAI